MVGKRDKDTSGRGLGSTAQAALRRAHGALGRVWLAGRARCGLLTRCWAGLVQVAP